jgi:hypothetical protein
VKTDFKRPGLITILLLIMILVGIRSLAANVSGTATASVVAPAIAVDAFDNLAQSVLLQRDATGRLTLRIRAATAPDRQTESAATGTAYSPVSGNTTAAGTIDAAEFTISELVQMTVSDGMLSGNLASGITVSSENSDGQIVIIVTYN